MCQQIKKLPSLGFFDGIKSVKLVTFVDFKNRSNSQTQDRILNITYLSPDAASAEAAASNGGGPPASSSSRRSLPGNGGSGGARLVRGVSLGSLTVQQNQQQQEDFDTFKVAGKDTLLRYRTTNFFCRIWEIMFVFVFAGAPDSRTRHPQSPGSPSPTLTKTRRKRTTWMPSVPLTPTRTRQRQSLERTKKKTTTDAKRTEVYWLVFRVGSSDIFIIY